MQATPTRWWNWNFTLREDQVPVAQLGLCSWRDRGALTIDGRTHAIRRQRIGRSCFLLERDGVEVARGTKRSIWRRTIDIEHEGASYVLRPVNAWCRAFVMERDGREIGRIEPEGWLTRRARVDLDRSLPLTLRVFAFWLVAMLWRRASNAAASGGGG